MAFIYDIRVWGRVGQRGRGGGAWVGPGPEGGGRGGNGFKRGAQEQGVTIFSIWEKGGLRSGGWGGGQASILILRGKGLGDVGKNACKAAIRADGHTLEALLSW